MAFLERNCGTATSSSFAGGTAWSLSSASALQFYDTNYASNTITGAGFTANLRCKNFGFGTSVPSGVTIQGIEVVVITGSTCENGFLDTLQLIKSDSNSSSNRVGDNKAAGYFGPGTSYYFGGSTDLWGLSWTPSDFNNGNFGVDILLQNFFSNTRTFQLELVAIKVFYDDPNRVLPVSSTNVNLTSQSVDLALGGDTTLAVTATSTNLTAVAVGLTLGGEIALPVDAGSLALAVNDVGFNYNQGGVLGIAPASVILSGMAINLVAAGNVVFGIDQSAVSLTPFNVTLQAGGEATLGVSASAVSLVPVNVAFTVAGGSVLTIDSAGVMLTGGEVGFVAPKPQWPFVHNWSDSYRSTLSFKTDILVTRSGLEQRRALRKEPRRVLETRVTVSTAQNRLLDRFFWKTQSAPFSFAEPLASAPSLASVRFAESFDVDHLTSGVSTADLTLVVDPGTDATLSPVLDAVESFGGRYVLPYPVNWQGGVSETLLFPRETIDFEIGRISTFKPVAFGSRQAVLPLIDEPGIVDFFTEMRGRQRDFWTMSPIDDMVVVEIVSNTLTVEGDLTYMFNADTVHRALRIEMTNGGVFYRVISAVALSGDVTLLSMNYDVPLSGAVRRCAWVRLARFASDDLTVEWVTAEVCQVQPQIQSLPAAEPDAALFDGAAQWAVDYYGWTAFEESFIDPFDYLVNTGLAPLETLA